MVVKNGSSVKERSKNSNSCFLYAAQNGHLEIVKYLLQKEKSSIDQTNLKNESCVLLSAKNGHLDTVKWLLAQGASINERNSKGDSCVSLAAKKGHLNTVKWLLENNGPFDEKERNIEVIRLQMIQLKIKQVLSILKSNDNCAIKQEFPPTSFESWKEIQSFLNEKSDQMEIELNQDNSIEETLNLKTELNTIRSKISQLQSRKREVERKLTKLEKSNKKIETNTKLKKQNQVLLNEMCTDVSILCENENKMNKELEELFNEKPIFQNFFGKWIYLNINKFLWIIKLMENISL